MADKDLFPDVPPRKPGATPPPVGVPQVPSATHEKTDVAASQPVQPAPKVTPEQASAAQPKKEVQSSPKTPQKPPRKPGGGAKLLMGFLFFGGGLFVILYLILLWGVVGGATANPLFEILGLEAADLKSNLIVITNGVFGFLSLIFLFSTLIHGFQ